MTALARNRIDSVTAANQFGRWITLKQGGVLTLEGTWSATVSLQRMGSDGNVVDVTGNTGSATTMTTNGTYTIAPSATPAQYRWGVKTGNFTSGTVNGMIEGR